MMKILMLSFASAVLFSLMNTVNAMNKREIDSTIMGSLIGSGV
nr:venom peptide [Acharia stimulea]